jgi:hypothetical protein
VQHPVRRGPYDNYSKRLLSERLLKLKVAIHRDESIETPRGAPE